MEIDSAKRGSRCSATKVDIVCINMDTIILILNHLIEYQRNGHWAAML